MSRPYLKIGHRGFPKEAPGNTMAGFRAAHRLGCHWVECDCCPTKDGVIVLSHDDRVKDASGREYRIEEHTAAELAKLDLGRGEGVPTLAELVAWAVGRVGIMADVKCSGYEREIGDALLPIAVKDKVAPGADDEARGRFRCFHPTLPISLSLGADRAAELDRRIPDLDTDAVTPQHPLVTPERMAALHARGLKVYAWTVDDLPTMRRLLELGVDGIISNRADLLAEL
ncbi:MAG TPA: glycerophosphodiester phosphodiesterase [Armatimonadota bacterium]|jgi:glycerophosphoryl diester phosphodiesterase